MLFQRSLVLRTFIYLFLFNILQFSSSKQLSFGDTCKPRAVSQIRHFQHNILIGTSPKDAFKPQLNAGAKSNEESGGKYLEKSKKAEISKDLRSNKGFSPNTSNKYKKETYNEDPPTHPIFSHSSSHSKGKQVDDDSRLNEFEESRQEPEFRGNNRLRVNSAKIRTAQPVSSFKQKSSSEHPKPLSSSKNRSYELISKEMSSWQVETVDGVLMSSEMKRREGEAAEKGLFTQHIFDTIPPLKRCPLSKPCKHSGNEEHSSGTQDRTKVAPQFVNRNEKLDEVNNKFWNKHDTSREGMDNQPFVEDHYNTAVTTSSPSQVTKTNGTFNASVDRGREDEKVGIANGIFLVSYKYEQTQDEDGKLNIRKLEKATSSGSSDLFKLNGDQVANSFTSLSSPLAEKGMERGSAENNNILQELRSGLSFSIPTEKRTIPGRNLNEDCLPYNISQVGNITGSGFSIICKRHKEHFNPGFLSTRLQTKGEMESSPAASTIQLGKVVKKRDTWETSWEVVQSQAIPSSDTSLHSGWMRTSANAGEKINTLLGQNYFKPRYENGTSGVDVKTENETGESAEQAGTRMNGQDSWEKLSHRKPSQGLQTMSLILENRSLNKNPTIGNTKELTEINQGEAEGRENPVVNWEQTYNQEHKLSSHDSQPNDIEKDAKNAKRKPSVNYLTRSAIQIEKDGKRDIVGLHNTSPNAQYKRKSEDKEMEGSAFVESFNINSSNTANNSNDYSPTSHVLPGVSYPQRVFAKTRQGIEKSKQNTWVIHTSGKTAQGMSTSAVNYGFPSRSRSTRRMGKQVKILKSKMNDGTGGKLTLDEESMLPYESGATSKQVEVQMGENERVTTSRGLLVDTPSNLRLKRSRRDVYSMKRSGKNENSMTSTDVKSAFESGQTLIVNNVPMKIAQRKQSRAGYYPKSGHSGMENGEDIQMNVTSFELTDKTNKSQEEVETKPKPLMSRYLAERRKNDDPDSDIDTQVKLMNSLEEQSVEVLSIHSEFPLMTPDHPVPTSSEDHSVTSRAVYILTTKVPDTDRQSIGTTTGETLNISLLSTTGESVTTEGTSGNRNLDSSSISNAAEEKTAATPEMNIVTSPIPYSVAPDSQDVGTTPGTTKPSNDDVLPTSESMTKSSPTPPSTLSFISSQPTTLEAKSDLENSPSMEAEVAVTTPESATPTPFSSTIHQSEEETINSGMTTEIPSIKDVTAPSSNIPSEESVTMKESITESAVTTTSVMATTEKISAAESPPATHTDQPQGTTLMPTSSRKTDEGEMQTSTMATSEPSDGKGNEREEIPVADAPMLTTEKPESAAENDDNDSPQCDRDLGLECSDRMEKCVCRSGLMYNENEKKCMSLVGSKCSTGEGSNGESKMSSGGCPLNAECKLETSESQKGICQCIPGFVQAEDKSSCLAGWNTNCSQGKGDSLGNKCHPDFDCSSSGKCICKANHTIGMPHSLEGMSNARSELKCLLDYGSHCDSSQDLCNEHRFLRCSKPSGICECADSSNQVYNESIRECVARAGSTCTVAKDQSKMADKMLMCIGNSTCTRFGNETHVNVGTCKCLDMYESHWQGYCVLKGKGNGAMTQWSFGVTGMGVILISFLFVHA